MYIININQSVNKLPVCIIKIYYTVCVQLTIKIYIKIYLNIEDIYIYQIHVYAVKKCYIYVFMYIPIKSENKINSDKKI